MNSTSVFDLSPSEKLQMVEDLGDDLAAEPETVPVHEWQKRNWHAGKRIWQQTQPRDGLGMR